MRDYTSNFYCDFFWINDLLEVKKNSRNKFQAKIKKEGFSTVVSFTNVTIFGTIIEIRQIDQKKYLYHIDDGTGVIVCKHGEDQFEEAIATIEREQENVLDQSIKFNQSSLDRSSFSDASMEDSIFNEKTIQDDELGIVKKNLLTGLQSIWNDVYDSFVNLLGQYKIGDTVLVDGKLYSYFDSNQIYVNNIRLLELEEEMVKISNKLRDGFDPLTESPLARKEFLKVRRCSGLMTFDHLDPRNVRIPAPRTIEPDRNSPILPRDIVSEVPPQVESTMTFDTFNGE